MVKCYIFLFLVPLLHLFLFLLSELKVEAEDHDVEVERHNCNLKKINKHKLKSLFPSPSAGTTTASDALSAGPQSLSPGMSSANRAPSFSAPGSIHRSGNSVERHPPPPPSSSAASAAAATAVHESAAAAAAASTTSQVSTASGLRSSDETNSRALRV